MTEKIGSWIEDGYYDRHPFVCSYCGEQIPFPMSGWKPKYCPSCGAKMVSVTELADYEDLPIDLDDDYHCDMCCHPISNGCDKREESDCPYGLGECCDDNLAANVGRICFDHNVSTNVAMAIIEIIQKERDRNEYLHIYREHIPAE